MYFLNMIIFATRQRQQSPKQDKEGGHFLTVLTAFLAADAVLILLNNVVDGLVVYPQVIRRQLLEELPFMATENILMAAVTAGGDRQTLHELIRQHSQDAAAVVKQQGGSNDLLDRLKEDQAFSGIDIDELADPNHFVGRAPEQVDEFLNQVIGPVRERHGASLNQFADEVTV